jgi:hypothetical protein
MEASITIPLLVKRSPGTKYSLSLFRPTGDATVLGTPGRQLSLVPIMPQITVPCFCGKENRNYSNADCSAVRCSLVC